MPIHTIYYNNVEKLKMDTGLYMEFLNMILFWTPVTWTWMIGRK